MLSLVHTTIVRHGLMPAGCHVLAGVSGGADSVALLYALHHLRPRLTFALTAVHVHHGLRGAEADADAEFVSLLAWRLGVGLGLAGGLMQIIVAVASRPPRVPPDPGRPVPA